jgi:hypothetical protein
MTVILGLRVPGSRFQVLGSKLWEPPEMQVVSEVEWLHLQVAPAVGWGTWEPWG